jgi:hypothetical protein
MSLKCENTTAVIVFDASSTNESISVNKISFHWWYSGTLFPFHTEEERMNEETMTTVGNSQILMDIAV